MEFLVLLKEEVVFLPSLPKEEEVSLLLPSHSMELEMERSKSLVVIQEIEGSYVF